MDEALEEMIDSTGPYVLDVEVPSNRPDGLSHVGIAREVAVIEHGRTEIHLPHWGGIEQQHGFVHGGIVGTIADSAAGYAAMTVVAASASVLTVEYKLNLVAPADGQRLIARGQVRSLCNQRRQGNPLCAHAANDHCDAR